MKADKSHGKCEKAEKRRLLLISYLTYLLIATLLFTGVSFSRFATTSSGEDSVRVAVMAMDSTAVIDGILLAAPGESQTFKVTVTNKEGSQVCEVAQEYTMYVEALSGNMNLTYSFVGADTTAYTDADGVSHTAVTGSFEAGVEKTVTYTIQVTWDAGAQPEYMAFEVDALQVVVQTSQID